MTGRELKLRDEMKAEFYAIQEGFRHLPDVPLFNIVDKSSHLYQSTVSLRTLWELGYSFDEIKWVKE